MFNGKPVSDGDLKKYYWEIAKRIAGFFFWKKYWAARITGLLFFGFGLMWLSVSLLTIKDAQRVVGEVVGYVQVTSTMNTAPMYAAQYAVQQGAETVIVHSTFSSDKKTKQIGERLLVYYDPAHPNSVVESLWTELIFGGVLIFVGLLLSVGLPIMVWGVKKALGAKSKPNSDGVVR